MKHPALARIPSLDGLRAISIFLVIISHLSHFSAFKTFTNLYGSHDKFFPPLGPLGVRIFFAISGFLITGLLLRELERNGHIDLKKFYFRRTLRIFPPYYFFLFVVVSLHVQGRITLSPGDLSHALTYTINYFPGRSWYVGHGWSLSVEEQFYLLWPAVLLLAGRRKGLWMASSLIVLCPLIRLGYYYLYPSLIRYEVGYRFETVADSIAVGCLLAGIHEQLRSKQVYREFLRSKLFIFLPLIVLLGNSLNARSRLGLLIGVTIQNIGIAACLAWCITNHSGRIGKVLNSKPMIFLGVMSYSIYLWQQLFLNPFSSSVTSQLPLKLVLVGAASLASYYLIERPSLKLRHLLEHKIFARENLQSVEVSSSA